MALVTSKAVASWLELPAIEDPQLDRVVNAVNTLVQGWIDTDKPTDAHRQGALMLAARVYRRRNSPGGLEALGELGPVYVSRNDPDLAIMLGLGNYLAPKVG